MTGRSGCPERMQGRKRMEEKEKEMQAAGLFKS